MLGKNKRKTEKTRSGGGGGRSDSPGSLARLESQAVTGGDREREGNKSNVDVERVGPSATLDESKSDWKSTASPSPSAELLLHGVRETNTFRPLKAIAGGPCSDLENCNVRLSPRMLFATLISPTANKGKEADNRIAGTLGQCACGSAQQARP